MLNPWPEPRSIFLQWSNLVSEVGFKCRLVVLIIGTTNYVSSPWDIVADL